MKKDYWNNLLENNEPLSDEYIEENRRKFTWFLLSDYLGKNNQKLFKKFFPEDVSYSVTDVAEDFCRNGIEIGRCILSSILRNEEIMYCSDGCNIPHDKYVKEGLFVVKKMRVSVSNGQVKGFVGQPRG